MARPILMLLAIASFAGAGLAQVVHAPYAHASDAIDQNRADTFDKNMFMHPPGDKASACFSAVMTQIIWRGIRSRKWQR